MRIAQLAGAVGVLGASILAYPGPLSAQPKVPVEAAAEGCAQAHFFDLFRRAHRFWAIPGGFELGLSATQHSADCGAPDSYGSLLHLRVRALPGPGCKVSEASIMVEDWGLENDRVVIEIYEVRGGAVDLASPQLHSVDFRNAKGDRVLKLLSDHQGFYFYDDLEPDAELREGLDPADGESGCCWGATQHWSTFSELEEEQDGPPRSALEILGPEPWQLAIEKFEPEGSNPACKNFLPTEAEPTLFLRNARPIIGYVGDFYPEPSCTATFRVTSSRGKFWLRLTNTGVASLRSEKESTHLACDEPCRAIFTSWGTRLDQWQRSTGQRPSP